MTELIHLSISSVNSHFYMYGNWMAPSKAQVGVESSWWLEDDHFQDQKMTIFYLGHAQLIFTSFDP